MTEAPRRSACACAAGSSSVRLVTDCACSKQKEEPKAPTKALTNKEGFNPKPYTFRLQQPDNGPLVRAPPFHIQLDHTIAVLWALYRQPDNAQDVGYLQWAKHFLVRIRNNHGDMPKDVESIVKAIDERLLSLYADLCKVTFHKPQICCTLEPENCQAKQSVTFTEMVKQQPEAVQRLFCVDSRTWSDSCSSHVACDCKTSKDEMAKYLKEQRAERLRIIGGELKRLKELDQAIGIEHTGRYEWTALYESPGASGSSKEGVQPVITTEETKPTAPPIEEA